MIIFLYGQDTYRMKEKLESMIEGYKKVRKSGLNLKYFDCENGKEDVFKSLESDLKQVCMFKEKKLAVITNPFSNPSFKESFVERGASFIDSEDIVILYQEGEIRKNDSLLKFLEKKAKCQKFEFLEGPKLRSWIQDKFSKYGSRINSEAEVLLLDYVGNDLWRLNNEIQKLCLYKKGRGVERGDVKLLVRPLIEADIFKTVDAIGDRDKKLALRLMNKHIAKGDAPIYLLSMINYQFRNLLIVKDLIEKSVPYGAIAKKSGLHPFVIRKTYYQCQRFSLTELKKIYQKIFQVDFEVKTGKMNPEAGLETLILSC